MGAGDPRAGSAANGAGSTGTPARGGRADTGAGRWDTSAITQREAGAVKSFLERRDSLEAGSRRQLAQRLADGLKVKVTAAPADIDPEQFLEELIRTK